MKITKTLDLRDFEGWAGAIDTLAEMSVDEMDTLQVVLEELYPEGLTDTQLNDILWFEDKWISEMIGRELFE